MSEGRAPAMRSGPCFKQLALQPISKLRGPNTTAGLYVGLHFHACKLLS